MRVITDENPDDWCGVFIRGDVAFASAALLRLIAEQYKMSALDTRIIMDLAADLMSCREPANGTVQVVRLVDAEGE